MDEYNSIFCDSDQEIVECAKYLIKKGYEIANFNKYTGIFVDFQGKSSFKDTNFWKGLTKLGNDEWIRFHPQNEKEKQIKFKTLLRKDKLIKIGKYGK